MEKLRNVTGFVRVGPPKTPNAQSVIQVLGGQRVWLLPVPTEPTAEAAVGFTDAAEEPTLTAPQTTSHGTGMAIRGSSSGRYPHRSSSGSGTRLAVPTISARPATSTTGPRPSAAPSFNTQARGSAGARRGSVDFRSPIPETARSAASPNLPARGVIFTLDRVFPMGCSQATVYQDSEPLIRLVLTGRSVCLVSYGPSGSGKTHIMNGGYFLIT